MPETKIYDATVCAQRIINSCHKLSVKTGDNKSIITVSIGITQVNNYDESIENIITRADNALYKAKENGRDQIQVI